MNSRDLFTMSFRNLWRRKTRTFLTMLGVVIGTASIVVMISLGIAMDVGFQEQLAQMGQLNIIEVNNYGNVSVQTAEPLKLDDKAVSYFRSIAGVEAVMPVKSTYVKMAVGKYVAHVSLIGIDPAIQEAFDFKIGEGRLLQAGDKEAVLFGEYLRQWFYNPRSRFYEESQVNVVTDKLIVTNNMSYGDRRTAEEIGNNSNEKEYRLYNARGVGQLAQSNDYKDYSAFASLTFVEELIREREASGSRDNIYGQDTTQYETIRVKVAKIDDVEAINNTIRDQGYSTFSYIDISKEMKKTSGLIQAVLGGIGAISLLVAAIGIANTMVMSIYERTREIGVMKVLGARLSDIRSMFLLEAALIGLCGGVIGISLSYGVSLVMNSAGGGILGNLFGVYGEHKLSVIPVELAVIAVVFSTVVGIAAGYSPARRAMRLSALEAIKNE